MSGHHTQTRTPMSVFDVTAAAPPYAVTQHVLEAFCREAAAAGFAMEIAGIAADDPERPIIYQEGYRIVGQVRLGNDQIIPVEQAAALPLTKTNPTPGRHPTLVRLSQTAPAPRSTRTT